MGCFLNYATVAVMSSFSIPQERSKGPELLEPVFFVLEPPLLFSLHLFLRRRHVLGLDVDDPPLPIPQHHKRQIFPGSGQINQPAGIAGGFDVLHSNLLDNVLFFQAAQMDGRLAINLVHQRPVDLGNFVLLALGVQIVGLGILSDFGIVFTGPIGRAGC